MGLRPNSKRLYRDRKNTDECQRIRVPHDEKKKKQSSPRFSFCFFGFLFLFFWLRWLGLEGRVIIAQPGGVPAFISLGGY